MGATSFMPRACPRGRGLTSVSGLANETTDVSTRVVILVHGRRARTEPSVERAWTRRVLPTGRTYDWLRTRLRQRGLWRTTAKCLGSAQGLRKAGAVRAAGNGATVPQPVAILGWTTEKMAALCTRAAEIKRLGMEGAALMHRDHSQNEKRPHRSFGAGVKLKSRN
jgi:hypothetical protein